jgi:glycerophosphoryl diester phosphodiesterase
MVLKKPVRIISLLGVVVAATAASNFATAQIVGDRPAELVESLTNGELKSKLQACVGQPVTKTEFSIAHRGAPLGYPEHTREGYVAAAEMGAGIIECDVTFTSDKTLVCRHSQCDLHTTTNILETPLAAKCSSPPDMSGAAPYKNVQCCTSDLTLAEFRTLKGRPDSGNKDAPTLEAFYSLAGTPQEHLQSSTGTLMTHRESVDLFKSLGVRMIPELKKPQVDMPFQGDYTQQQYAQALVDEYLDAGVDPADVFLQSFNLEDVNYWLENTPEFGRQAAWLDGRFDLDPSQPESARPSMAELAESGVSTIAPPLWMLLALEDEKIVPSHYAKAASAAGLNVIAWTAERSGSLQNGGGWYYKTINKAITSDGDVFRVLDVLAGQVKVRGVFSDWPATTTFYANCNGYD